MSKGFGPLAFKGSTQEKSASKIFRFGYGKAVNDKKVPDPVGSEVSVLHLIPNKSLEKLNSLENDFELSRS